VHSHSTAPLKTTWKAFIQSLIRGIFRGFPGSTNTYNSNRYRARCQQQETYSIAHSRVYIEKGFMRIEMF